jgi:hypothetical protein
MQKQIENLRVKVDVLEKEGRVKVLALLLFDMVL